MMKWAGKLSLILALVSTVACGTGRQTTPPTPTAGSISFMGVQMGGGAQYPQFHVPVSGATSNPPSASKAHKGPDQYAVDYTMTTEGAYIYPTLPGVIVYSGCTDDYGCVVVMRHENASWSLIYYSIYAHLQTGTNLSDGTTVSNGIEVDITKDIGRMGKTGTGSNDNIHLHFVVRTSDQKQEGLTALYGHVDQTAFDFRPYMP